MRSDRFGEDVEDCRGPQVVSMQVEMRQELGRSQGLLAVVEDKLLQGGVAM